MKSLQISLLFSLISFSVLAQTVYIHGKFRSKQKDFKIEDLSAFQYLRPFDEHLDIITDSTGNFSFKLSLKKPGYFRIGRNILYLSPGDALEVDINHADPLQSTFKGRGSIVNHFLSATPFPKAGSYLEGGKYIYSDPQKTFYEIINASNKRLKALAALQNKNQTFNLLERARISADQINSILSTPYYARQKLKLSDEAVKEYEKAFNAIAQKTIDTNLSKLKNATFLQLVVFRDIASFLVQKTNDKNTPALKRIADWLKADSLVNLMGQMENKKEIAAFKPQLMKIKSEDFRQAAVLTQQTLIQYGNGDLATDFDAIDAAGNKVSLANLKGKVIFIDLWATWCGPCLAEMPAFEKLKAQFAKNNEVAFVSLSIDDNIEAWHKNLSARKVDGLQWHVSRKMLDKYQVINIPRAIIINQEFKIINFKAPLPSNRENSLIINQLINKSKVETIKFTIDGNLDKALATDILYLNYVNNQNEMIRDSVFLKAGHFHFEGKVKEVRKANLLLSKVGRYVLKKNSDQTDIYLESAPAVIKGVDSILTAEVSGGKENNAYQALKAKLIPLQKANLNILFSLTPDKRKDNTFMLQVKEKYQALAKQEQEIKQNYVDMHPDLISSLDVLIDYAGAIINVDEIYPLYQKFTDAVKNSSSGKIFGNKLIQLAQTKIGAPAPDFILPDTLGKTIQLSKFKGKYVLVDFWASWCVPCRAENPHLVQAYRIYHNKNFEIISISMDEKKTQEAWKKAITDDKLTWLNVSDLMGFRSEVALKYQISAIPQNVLIDPNGKIIAKNLRDSELVERLKIIFNN